MILGKITTKRSSDASKVVNIFFFHLENNSVIVLNVCELIWLEEKSRCVPQSAIVFNGARLVFEKIIRTLADSKRTENILIWGTIHQTLNILVQTWRFASARFIWNFEECVHFFKFGEKKSFQSKKWSRATQNILHQLFFGETSHLCH